MTFPFKTTDSPQNSASQVIDFSHRHNIFFRKRQYFFTGKMNKNLLIIKFIENSRHHPHHRPPRKSKKNRQKQPSKTKSEKQKIDRNHQSSTQENKQHPHKTSFIS